MDKPLRHPPVLDPGFLPAVIWNRSYRERLHRDSTPRPLSLAIERGDGTVSVFNTEVFPHEGGYAQLNRKYVERLLKFLLWQRGGFRVTIGGDSAITSMVKSIYNPAGERAFDYAFMGEKVYGRQMEVCEGQIDAMPEANETAVPLGRNLDGCRIGFDLGGSDRKCAALIDGQVVFSEEVPWNPYFESNPQYHYDGINDTLKRAAAKLPRIDAIGGSAAGVYVNNEVRVASLFRGVAKEDFENRIRRIFFELAREWGGVPFEVVNDGEVTALAGSMSLQATGVLGISLGTSQAGGYVDPDGSIRPWLNELAFAPIDYRLDAPVDEWSGDIGCGAQYFSQQGVGRLIPSAGICIARDMPLPEQLSVVQQMMANGDLRSRWICETIGAYLGYAIAHYAEFYDVQHVLILGRVTSGEGGQVIVEKARKVLEDEFPELSGSIRIHLPSEKDKRHGQAVAAASLPKLNRVLTKV
ncbi:MAG TPA: ROK family protein [Chthoniobacteraceae bacterium]|nr:ROK family protein [Chthoniobacteraceae bacterium]